MAVTRRRLGLLAGALSDLDGAPDALWSLLVLSGYLRAERADVPPGEPPLYWLSIPNREVRAVYVSTFRALLRERLGGEESDVERLTASLLAGDAEALEEQLQAFTANVLSYHDTARRPEQVYQAFVVGLLAALEPAYHMRSNRESGHGRPDVLVRPYGRNTGSSTGYRKQIRPVVQGGAVAMDRIFGPDTTREP